MRGEMSSSSISKGLLAFDPSVILSPPSPDAARVDEDEEAPVIHSTIFLDRCCQFETCAIKSPIVNGLSKEGGPLGPLSTMTSFLGSRFSCSSR